MIAYETLIKNAFDADPLTPRQRDVAELASLGYSNRAIAQTLGLSVRTVENHITSIFCKLNVHSRMQLAAHGVSNVIARADDRALVNGSGEAARAERAPMPIVAVARTSDLAAFAGDRRSSPEPRGSRARTLCSVSSRDGCAH